MAALRRVRENVAPTALNALSAAEADIARVTLMGHHVAVYYVRTEAVRWIDDGWPGLVEVHLRETNGTVAAIVDKVPVLVDGDRLPEGAELPVEIGIPCDVVAWTLDETGNRCAAVRLHHSIQDEHGRGTFVVSESEVTSHLPNARSAARPGAGS
jgi:hypothetical protein